ncbi:MAG: ABC transporter permease [Enterocloster asparagiformis]|nr:ABC transporter permease [Enterocloster asparagiformis]
MDNAASLSVVNQNVKKQSNFKAIMKRLFRNHVAVMGLAIIIVMTLIAVFSPLIMPYAYEEMDLRNMYSAPSMQHLFGTDELGRDILSRLMYGARYSLSIGILSVLASAVVGGLLGAVAGYYGGMTDNIIMRLLDILSAFPGILLSIVISAVLGAGFDKCIIALAIGTIPNYTRIIRGSVMSVKQMEYLEAATSINCGNARIILRHVIPNCVSPLIVQATMGVANAILVAASLSFIGLGVQPPEPEWGAMLSAGRNYIRDYPHMVLFPGIAIMIAVLSLNMLGDGLRDALDPKLKS